MFHSPLGAATCIQDAKCVSSRVAKRLLLLVSSILNRRVVDRKLFVSLYTSTFSTWQSSGCNGITEEVKFTVSFCNPARLAVVPCDVHTIHQIGGRGDCRKNKSPPPFNDLSPTPDDVVPRFANTSKIMERAVSGSYLRVTVPGT